MNKKELVFKYLDLLFKDSKFITDDNKFKIINNDNIICSTSERNGRIKGFHFSYSEFYFILNMFSLSHGEVVDYIMEYISNKVPQTLFNINLPFFPYL